MYGILTQRLAFKEFNLHAHGVYQVIANLLQCNQSKQKFWISSKTSLNLTFAVILEWRSCLILSILIFSLMTEPIPPMLAGKMSLLQLEN